MQTPKLLIGLFVALLASFALAGSASAGVVVLKVVDQHGQEIPGSKINVLSQEVNTGESLLLPEGTQFFSVLPGIQGHGGSGTLLFRLTSGPSPTQRPNCCSNGSPPVGRSG